MRLFTHNFLQCHVKGCNTKNYPLKIKSYQLQTKACEYNEEFIGRYLCKLDYPVVLSTLSDLGIEHSLPEEFEENAFNLRELHRVLFEIKIQDGVMCCEGCGHDYAIRDGIPNMLLSEDEIN